MNISAIEVIQGMLAPGIMISACGLLLLGMNNKYSLVVNRIRMLNTEFRGLTDLDEARKSMIRRQLPLLIKRVKFVKNAVWFYTFGIAMFIFSIFSIGINFVAIDFRIDNFVSIPIFVLGLLSVLSGIVYAAIEVLLGFKILKIETANICEK
jgi:hypothetical protein